MTNCLLTRHFTVEFTSGTAKPCRAMRPLTHSLDLSKEGLVMNASQGPRRDNRTPEYVAWQNMRQRAKQRGITVCERWDSFENFLADMGERPEGLTLSRIGNVGDYKPGNCRWATVASRWAAVHGPDCDCGYCRHQGKRTHGDARKSPEYLAWQNMRARCNRPSHPSYAAYGGRGIKVCERWDDYANFLADMGRRPGPGYSIERKDNNGPYSPENCRWATEPEQRRNTRKTRVLTFNGKTQCLTDWAAEIGISLDGLRARLQAGMSAEEALTRPVGRWIR